MAKKYEVRERKKRHEETVVAITWTEPAEELVTLRDIDQRVKEIEIEIAHLQNERERLLGDKAAIEAVVRRKQK